MRGACTRRCWRRRAPRVATFHAFCQELLTRFPVEAGVPPGFELTETQGVLADTAWDALCAEAADAPGGAVAAALEHLFAWAGTYETARAAVMALLARRADWWAWTEDGDDPVAFACDDLRAFLDVDETQEPAAGFLAAQREPIARVREALAARANKGDLAHVEAIDAALATADPGEALETITPAFLRKTDGLPIEQGRKVNNPLVKALGGEGRAQQFVADHFAVAEALQLTHDALLRRDNLALGRAWYAAGHRLVEHFQALKHEQRLLDFTDLEWQAWRLLNTSDHAEWVQYKLDARIDHLLVDEFQDTNPSQWRLLRPLLAELAAGAADERARTVFLVGDPKQSIYRFRRADPRLQDDASRWLQEHLDAVAVELHASRRSAAPIIELVNRVFDGARVATSLPAFTAHDTVRTDLWGRVELLPPSLPDADDEDADDDAIPERLRDPLTEPTPIERDERFHREGLAIAERLGALIDAGTSIGSGDDGARARLGRA
ncbi:MAG: UvrD-helicase domain-containing protein [Halofilum sp. (in: g-proteobacteria)]|nr:UvrD-helicase domain-containing protein [Halofilum sp. (in: g-proteobacteria)]